MNKVNITINSRVYTVVADEEESYIKSLCEYVNDKVNTVLREGSHVMGERPIVLAALNICDEYFKLLNSSEESVKTSELMTRINELEEEMRDIKRSEAKARDSGAEVAEELNVTQKVLEETEEKVKFLEGQITLKENQMKKQRSDFAIRERELLDMLDSK
ncbi:MAG: cell division protein ZapA [Clostridia bacterium]|nr:cell division protein ZapA [Clostridia bacterium]